MQLYYPDLTFTVGDTFPIDNPYPGKEGSLLAMHDGGLHLILFANNVDDYLPIWTTRMLAIALTDFENIPFLCLTFKDSPLTLLYSMNIYGLIGDERGPWLRSTKHELGVLLIDNTTGRLASLRKVETKLLSRLREICSQQWKQYANAEEVEHQIQRLYTPPANEAVNQVTAQRVFTRAQFSNQVIIQSATLAPTSVC